MFDKIRKFFHNLTHPFQLLGRFRDKINNYWIAAIHMTFALLCILIGMKKDDTPKIIFFILFIYIIGIFLTVRVKIGWKREKIIRMLHYIPLIIILLIVAFKNQDAGNATYIMTLLIGISTFAYSCYKIYKIIKKKITKKK